MHNVTWQNDKLEETEIENIKECKTVDACEIKQEKRMEERVVDRQVCNETKTEQKEKCTLKYEQGPERVSITDLLVLVSKIYCLDYQADPVQG